MTDVQPPATEAAAVSEEHAAMPLAQRKKWLKIVVLVFIIAVLVYALWMWVAGRSVSTDNAYVGAETAAVSSMINGQVIEVLVKDTQQVKKGDLLLRIDTRDAQIALAQAQAELAKATRQYKQTSANSQSLNSQVLVRNDEIASAQAQLKKAQADVDKTENDYARRLKLVESGAISREEMASVRSAVATARAGLSLAQAQVAQAESSRRAAESTLAANEALIQGVDQQSTPDVQIAQAHVQQALLDLERTSIRAPVDGVITRRNVQVGQRVAPGTTVMMIVPIAQLYVDANFKEGQLAKVKAGQSVTLVSDYYGDDVVYHGKVVGFSGGTGAAFALIPAQNATGNWIKVVQRLPVRIHLDPKELAEHPLRVGLSMTATVKLTP